MYKIFNTYEVYSEIVSGRDPDRKNATISYITDGAIFIVHWSKK